MSFKIYKILLLTFFTLAISRGSLAASVDPAITDFFGKEGLHLKRLGLVNESLEKYSRAFLLDSNNRGLLVKLLGYSHHERLPVTKRVQLQQINDQWQHLNRLTERVEYYEKKREEIIQQRLADGADPEIIRLEMALIKKKGEAAYVDNASKFKSFNADSEDSLEMVIGELSLSIMELSTQVDILEAQMAQLNSFNKRFNTQELTVNGFDVDSMRRKHELYFAHYEGDGTLMMADRPLPIDGSITALALDVEEAKSIIEQKDKQIDILKDSVQALQSQQDLTKRIMEEKNNELFAMNQELVDLQAQLQLRSRIVQEKEEVLTDIKESSGDRMLELIEENKALAEQLNRQKKDVRQLEAMLVIAHSEAQGKVSTSIRRGNEENSHENLKQVQQLTTAKLKEIIVEREKGMAQQEKQIDELSNIIEMYKLLLNESKKENLASKQAMGELENGFDKLRWHLSQQSQTLKGTQFQLLSLKKDLTNIQTRFIALKNLPETKNYVRLEEEMNALDEELKNIHKFLLKQLSEFEKLDNSFIAGDVNDIPKVLELNLKRIQQN